MTAAAAGDGRALLVHGIWNARAWMAPFALLLRRHGIASDVFGYSSVFGDAERSVDALIRHLRRHPHARLVGHSLGGLIILEALRRAPDLAVERVVCLGSPLQGSAAARALAERHGLGLALGGSRDILVRGCAPWDGGAAVGAVAGVRARGLGKLFAHFDGPSDGTVGLEETRLPGLADHCTVPASHSGLVLSPQAAAQAAAFLREGRFQPAAGARSGA